MVHSYTKVWEVISKSDLKSELAGVLLSKKNLLLFLSEDYIWVMIHEEKICYVYLQF